jgi:hypothetical protein
MYGVERLTGLALARVARFFLLQDTQNRGNIPNN